ncbi:MAG: hypothetical protein QW320_09435 [Ignisphaera sp.]
MIGKATQKRKIAVPIAEEAIKDRREAIIAAIGLTTTIGMLIVNDVLQLMGYPHIQRRGLIPFTIAAGIYIFTKEPGKTLSKVDWGDNNILHIDVYNYGGGLEKWCSKPASKHVYE